jgi:hypothetical protein
MGSYLVSQGLPAQSHPLQIALALLHDTKETSHVKMLGVPEEGFASLGETMPQSLYAVIAMCVQRLSPQAQTALHALTTFLPKPESFSLEAALAVTQQSVETLDALCDAGLLEAWGLGRYLLHQAVADYVRVQGKVAAIQEQKVLPSSHSSPTSHPSTIHPQMKLPVQEGKSRPRLLGRRSILVGLVGGIMAVGGGVFVLDKLLMSADQPRAGSSTRWTGPQWIAGQRSKIPPALAVSSHGILHLVFVADASGNGLLSMSSQDHGATWNKTYSTGQSSLCAPALVVLNTTLYLAFIASDGSNQICIVSSQDGIHWSTKQETGQSSLCAPALAVFNNTLYLAFVASDGSNQICIISSDT